MTLKQAALKSGAMMWRAGAGAAFLSSLALAAATVIILLTYRTFELPTEGWAVVSAALVLHTQAKASYRLAAIRVAANIIGAIVALLALYLGGSTIAAIAIAILLVGLICHLAYLDDSVRTAYVSVGIVMAADRFAALSPPIDRIASVAFGSLVGVATSLLVELAARWRMARSARRVAPEGASADGMPPQPKSISVGK